MRVATNVTIATARVRMGLPRFEVRRRAASRAARSSPDSCNLMLQAQGRVAQHNHIHFSTIVLFTLPIMATPPVSRPHRFITKRARLVQPPPSNARAPAPETVEAFLARGGHIERLEPGVRGQPLAITTAGHQRNVVTE